MSRPVIVGISSSRRSCRNAASRLLGRTRQESGPGLENHHGPDACVIASLTIEEINADERSSSRHTAGGCGAAQVGLYLINANMTIP